MIPHSEIEKFKEKLIARNLTLACYIITEMTIKTIVYLLTEHDHFSSGNDSKHINSFLFLTKIENEKRITSTDKKIGNFVIKPGSTRLKELPPSKREYEAIYKIISGEEKNFLKTAYSRFHEALKSKSFDKAQKEKLKLHFRNNENWLDKIKILK